MAVIISHHVDGQETPLQGPAQLGGILQNRIWPPSRLLAWAMKGFSKRILYHIQVDCHKYRRMPRSFLLSLFISSPIWPNLFMDNHHVSYIIICLKSTALKLFENLKVFKFDYSTSKKLLLEFNFFGEEFLFFEM